MPDIFCSKCGRRLEPEARFCANCGKPVGKTAGADGGQKEGTWFRRDFLILASVIVITAVIYLIVHESPQLQRPTVEAPPGHETMSGAAMENLPTDYGSLVQMGNQYMDNQNFPMAAELYRRALDIDGSDPNVRSDFASCLHAMGLPNRALEEFRTILATDSDHPIVNFNMGIVFFGEGVTDSARYYWERYLELDPNGGPAESARQMLQQLEN